MRIRSASRHYRSGMTESHQLKIHPVAAMITLHSLIVAAALYGLAH